MKRRELLIGLGLTPLVLRQLACSAQDDGVAAETDAGDETASTDEVDYLFVHSADGAVLKDAELRLKGINPTTLFFSDRPDRIVGHMSNEEFIRMWTRGEDSFESNPPNAVLSILDAEDLEEIVVVLTAPRLESNDLVYNIRVLEGSTSASGGATSLFIDVIGRPRSPHSVAGRHRRHRRRNVSRHR
jgi:hypothetical protein